MVLSNRQPFPPIHRIDYNVRAGTLLKIDKETSLVLLAAPDRNSKHTIIFELGPVDPWDQVPLEFLLTAKDPLVLRILPLCQHLIQKAVQISDRPEFKNL